MRSAPNLALTEQTSCRPDPMAGGAPVAYSLAGRPEIGPLSPGETLRLRDEFQPSCLTRERVDTGLPITSAPALQHPPTRQAPGRRSPARPAGAVRSIPTSVDLALFVSES